MGKVYAASENVLLTAEAGRVLCLLEMFLTLFFTGCPKLNRGDIKILLLFVAGLFKSFLFSFVLFLFFFQSHRKSDFPCHRFQK